MRDYHLARLADWDLEDVMELYRICFVDDKFYQAQFAERGITDPEAIKAEITSKFTPQIQQVLKYKMSYGFWYGDQLVGCILNFDYRKMASTEPDLFLSMFGDGDTLDHEQDLHMEVRKLDKSITYMVAVAVHPKHRRKHLASKMLDETISWNPTGLVVSDVSNICSLEMYRQRNFTLKQLGPEYYLVIGPNYTAT